MSDSGMLNWENVALGMLLKDDQKTLICYDVVVAPWEQIMYTAVQHVLQKNLLVKNKENSQD